MGLGVHCFRRDGAIILMPQQGSSQGCYGIMGAMKTPTTFFHCFFGTQLLVGVLLLLNLFVPLALVLIMPVLVNIIFISHFPSTCRNRSGRRLMIIDLYLAWAYRKAYGPILTMRVRPN